MLEQKVSPAPLPERVTKACILEEHTDYVVVGLPLQKSCVAEFLPLFAALAERADVSAPATVYAPPARRKRFSTSLKLWATAGAGCLTLVLLSPLQPLWSNAPEPVELFSAKITTPVIRDGDELDLLVYVRRNRLCPQNIELTFMRTGDNATVWRDTLHGGSQAVTDHPISHLLPYKMPVGLSPGPYKYRRVAYNDCDGRTYASVIADDLPFEVAQ